MRRRAQADDRPARLDIVGEVLHLLVGQIAESREEHHQVGRWQALPDPGILSSPVGVDRAVGRIDGEQHRTLEAMALGEDLGQLRQRLFGAVFLVAADQHDVLPFARPIAAVEDDPRLTGRPGETD